MKKLIISIFSILLCFTLCGCDKKQNENNNGNKIEIPEYVSILFKEPVIYQAGEKSWNDFEWLKILPEYPESEKLDFIEYQEGDFISLYYKNADFSKVRKWADGLLDLGFYENKLDEKTEEHIAIKRRNLELDLRANPYFYYEDNSLWLFINRTEYQREMQDAEYFLQENNLTIEQAKELYDNQ